MERQPAARPPALHKSKGRAAALLSDLVLVQNVSKLYRLYRRPADRLRELLPRARARHTDFWALRDIGFEVEKGETLGLVGPNGCGKSTLLQIVCGILQPTSGRVVTRGRIAALLELGAGFNPEFTRAGERLPERRNHGAEPRPKSTGPCRPSRASPKSASSSGGR